MKEIDLDGNGELEFDEFLCMIKAAQRTENTSDLNKENNSLKQTGGAYMNRKLAK